VYALNRPHRRQVVELRHDRLCGFLPCSGEWSGLCHLGRRQRVSRWTPSQDPRCGATPPAAIWAMRLPRPAVASGVVYVGGGDQNVYALNASSGALLWSYPTAGYVRSSPAVGQRGGLYRLGRRQRVRAERPHRRPAVELQRRPTIWWSPRRRVEWSGLCRLVGRHVYALNAGSGALRWSYYIGAGYPQFSSPAVANGVVYIGADDRRAFALNAGTGALLWSHRSYGGKHLACSGEWGSLFQLGQWQGLRSRPERYYFFLSQGSFAVW